MSIYKKTYKVKISKKLKQFHIDLLVDALVKEKEILLYLWR